VLILAHNYSLIYIKSEHSMFEQRCSLLYFCLFLIVGCNGSSCFIGFCPLLCPHLLFKLLIVTYALPISSNGYSPSNSLSSLFLDHSSTSVLIICDLSKPTTILEIVFISIPFDCVRWRGH
jgi:hypothetical protein